jgi:predicted transcriptional regulator
MEARQETEVVLSPTIKSELGNLARGRRPARLVPAKKAIRRYVKRISKNAVLLATMRLAANFPAGSRQSLCNGRTLS